MGITFERVGNATVASLQGRLDSSNSSTVETELFNQLGDGGFVLDVSKLDYISSAGLRVVLVVAKRLKQSGSAFLLAGMQPHIRDVFEISGFLSLLAVAENRDEALTRV
ncbi:STAS domain-containing protein [Mesorhizobium australicum]|uniref:Anti-sigma factor antagonist n=1 Tax=Mesorhizobium australicum TaxID=536018 RepID=A0A1X7NT95_9HYPH|nr:STAS domain-containing protein [Mesorhizobium australicum]SMH40913.1 stage II sporulation protein AA (anti-sigma F factor antagonist) [Mesorhizobium australicum]